MLKIYVKDQVSNQCTFLYNFIFLKYRCIINSVLCLIMWFFYKKEWWIAVKSAFLDVICLRKNGFSNSPIWDVTKKYCAIVFEWHCKPFMSRWWIVCELVCTERNNRDHRRIPKKVYPSCQNIFPKQMHNRFIYKDHNKQINMFYSFHLYSYNV